MKRQDQKLLETVEPRMLESSQERHDEHKAPQLYRSPQVSFAGKAKRLMAASTYGNTHDAVQRFYSM